jgi:XRE family transcriptional regulator of biofilm formation
MDMNISDNIRRISTEKKITPYRIAKDGKISQSYLNEILHNKRKNPSIKILLKISKALDVQIEDLIKVN